MICGYNFNVLNSAMKKLLLVCSGGVIFDPQVLGKRSSENNCY